MVSEPARKESRRVHVAIVAPTHRILGGHSVQAASMLEGWAGDPDVHAWLVPINPEPPRALAWLLQVRYVRTVLTQLCYWPLLLRELRRADVVHIFSASSSGFLLSTVPAMVVARLLGTPIVLNYHSGDAPAHLGQSRLARWMLRHLPAAIVVPSRFLREVFAGHGLQADVVANSIDVRRFAYRVREPLRPRLISTRNLEPLYNVSCTLRAFARIQETYPDATLTVIGSGSDEAALRALADALRLPGVRFVGRVSPDDMARHYEAADVYVQTPTIDNMPVSILEAFASGLPVVSTCVGGVPAMLTDGRHGLLAPNDDHEAVADRVLALLADPDRARTMAREARISCEPFEWPQVRDGWLKVYRRAAVAPGGDTAIPVGAA